MITAMDKTYVCHADYYCIDILLPTMSMPLKFKDKKKPRYTHTIYWVDLQCHSYYSTISIESIVISCNGLSCGPTLVFAMSSKVSLPSIS